jgi:hypothetical protein
MSSIVSQSGNYTCIMQRDGNLVLYVGTDHTAANSKWSSRSNGKGNGPYKCVMQSDGNLVIYTFDN